MESQDIRSALDGLGEGEFRRVAAFNYGEVGVLWSSNATSPWERHPDDEELLHTIEGQVEVEVLTDQGSVVTLLKGFDLRRPPRALAPPPSCRLGQRDVCHSRTYGNVV
jgi:hypothetical protein